MTAQDRSARLRGYDRRMQRLQHIWAYLLKRKMRLYRGQ